MIDNRYPGTRVASAGAVVAAAIGLIFGTVAIASGTGTSQQGEPPELGQARQLLQADRNSEALEILDGFLEERPLDPAAHYYRGLAMGRMGNDLEAQHAFLVSASIAPGTPGSHRFAALASYRAGDYERAWEQTIVAARAGADMSDALALLREASEPPADIEQRMRAPLFFIELPNFEGLMASHSFTFNTRVTGRDSPNQTVEQVTNGDIPFDITADSPGGGAISAADWGDSASRRIMDNEEQIAEMMRGLHEAIAHGRAIGLTRQRQQATYYLQIYVDELAGAMAGRLVGCELLPGGAGSGVSNPYGDADVDTDVYEVRHLRRLVGRMVVYDRSSLEVYNEPLAMEDISSLADLHSRIGRYVDGLEEWLATPAGDGG